MQQLVFFDHFWDMMPPYRLSRHCQVTSELHSAADMLILQVKNLGNKKNRFASTLEATRGSWHRS